MYSEKVIEHFRNPHNYGKIKNPDGVGKVGNILCGDVMHLYIKVSRRGEKEIISDIKFETYGCAAAIATSSVITDLVKGKTIEQAMKISNRDIIKELGTLPPIKIHCSLLATDALKEAIYDYLKKKNKTIPKSLIQNHEKIIKEMQILEEKYKNVLS
jgi:nitrogen fixation NifU-like protein